MEFRPCIDIHNGKVKQIVGSSLSDLGDFAKENFVSECDAVFYARLYEKAGLRGGHIILLNGQDSPYYEATKSQAKLALAAFPGGMQVGGGINDSNALEFIEAGASHVIVTSYVFYDGRINYERLQKLADRVGPDKIVLDFSCTKKEDGYHIVTDRWQKVSEEILNIELLRKLSGYCDEFLVHAVDVEGKSKGIEAELAEMLGKFDQKTITYAGGVHNFEDLEKLKTLGRNHLNVTIGSALDLFGGPLKWQIVVDYCQKA